MKKNVFLCLATALIFTACASHYEVTGATRSRILIDNSWDAQPDAQAAAFIAPYKHQVDSLMSPIVGHVSTYMWAEAPESNLSNLLSDILIWAAQSYNEKPDFGIYNMGGIRAALSEGAVTYGDVLDVAPFENKICFFDMKGSDVRTLFEQIAKTGGQGLSKEIRMVMTKDGKLKSVKISGKDVDDSHVYRVASIDYLAEGNDGMTAFKQKFNMNSPQDKSNDLRFIIMNYLRENEAKGIVTDAKVEGRLQIEN